VSSIASHADSMVRELPVPGGPLHIVMVAPPYFDVPPAGYGGVEAVVAELADALVDRGHRVTLLGAGKNGTRARFVRIWDSTIPELLGQAAPEIRNALKVRHAIEQIAAADHIDVIHDHTFAGPLNAPFYSELGIPTVVTVHGPVDGDSGEYYRALEDTAHLVAISDRQRSLAPDLNWVGRVHNAIRPSEWPFREEKKDYALFLGRYAEYKGPHRALEATHAAGLRLVLAAKCNEPEEKAFFDAHVRPLLTADDSVFGEADAMAKRLLLVSARCLLFPIRWEEPFGMVMIEAMACGTPVVALRGGAVDEVIEDGVTGIICDDPSELPDALEAVRDLDPAACRRRVEEHFSVARLGAGYEATYRKTLAPQRVPITRSVGSVSPMLGRRAAATVGTA
jgi:hypothetical protein